MKWYLIFYQTYANIKQHTSTFCIISGTKRNMLFVFKFKYSSTYYMSSLKEKNEQEKEVLKYMHVCMYILKYLGTHNHSSS